MIFGFTIFKNLKKKKSKKTKRIKRKKELEEDEEYDEGLGKEGELTEEEKLWLMKKQEPFKISFGSLLLTRLFFGKFDDSKKC